MPARLPAAPLHVHLRAAAAAGGLASLLAAFGFGPAFVTACSSSSSSTPCTPDGTVTVHVTDQDVDDPSNFICDATVTLTAGSGAPRAFKPQGTDGAVANCIYTINAPPGTYTVTASKVGYLPLSQPLTLTQVACVTGSVDIVAGLYESQQEMTDAGDLPDVSVFRTPDGGLDGATDADAASSPQDAGRDATKARKPDAAVTHDAGHDAHMAVDAGHDAHVELDGGHDAGSAVDAGHDAPAGHDSAPEG
jgi:hypothetical protein